MTESRFPEFAVDRGPEEPADAASSRSREDRVFGLRAKLEHYFARMREAEQNEAAANKQSAMRQEALLQQLLDVADSFEDVFRMAEESRKMRKQKEALDAFRLTYEILLDVLEERGIHRIDVVGKRYGNVEFGGVLVPQPWEVIGFDSEGKNGGERSIVKKVLRSLWVRVAKRQLSVFRRAKVVC